MVARVLLMIVVSVLFVTNLVAEGSGKRTPSLQTVAVPLHFERNAGQTDPRVRFLSRGSGYSLFLAPDEAVFRLQSGSEQRAESADRHEVLRVKLEGASGKVRIEGESELPGRSNYFRGNDPSKWRTGIAQFAKVRYREVWPGIDLVYYGAEGKLEYDFILRPGADPRRIRLRYQGATSLETNGSGDLVVKLAAGEIVQHKPIVYQEKDGKRVPVEGSFALKGHGRVGFSVGAYDHERELTIDPVLSFSTFVGGSAGDVVRSLAVDSSNSVYLVGFTSSVDFPVVGAVQGTYADGGMDAFVSKIDPSGPTLVYSTYLGGSGGWELGQSIAVDSAGNAYAAGLADSADFPTTPGAVQTQWGGGGDVFITKLNPSGDGLVYSTFLGGIGYDEVDGLVVDGAGNAFATGFAGGPDFPVVNPIQATYGGGSSDSFVAKLNSTGSALIFSTFLGGSDEDVGMDIALDGSGGVVVVGSTLSTDFPTVAPFQSSNAGGRDAVVTRVDPTGTAFVHSTYLGGTAEDGAQGVGLDPTGNIYIKGATYSTDFPTRNPFQGLNGGDQDSFLTKLAADGGSLVYSTYLGGPETDGDFNLYANPLTVDGAGNLYFTTRARSGLPEINALQAGFGGGGADAYVGVLNQAGNQLLMGSYLGGSAGDVVRGCARDSNGRIWIGGTSISPDFPVYNPIQPALAGANDAVAARIDGPLVLSIAPPSGSSAGGTVVSVSGLDLDPAASVTIGGLSAAPVHGMSAPSDVGATTPALAPGALYDVTVTNPDTKAATLPNGWLADFSDVSQADPFHCFVGALLRSGITAGCGGGDYCRDNSITRAQMAVFLLKGKHGSTYVPPACTGLFPDVECAPTPAFAVDWIEQLFNEGITGGCGGGNYCPGNPVTRAQMAVFLLKAEHGSTYAPPPCTGIFPDVECAPTPAFAVDWIEQLYNEGITGGCGGGNYCPDNPVTRGQMAVFLTKTFGLPGDCGNSARP